MYIKVVKNLIEENKITTFFDCDEELKQYFNNFSPFFEYSENISSTPPGIAIIPFIVNILPITWLFNATLYVDELDENFYNCIDKLEQGYINMYPEASFQGKIVVDRLVDCSWKSDSNNVKASAFFSGGVDATHTLLRHFVEKPDLITIQGSDLHTDDEVGWKIVKKQTQKIAALYGLKPVFIKSSFAEFLKERALGARFAEVIHGYWYHNIQHGIGMLGLVAPYAYTNKISKHYIASSYDSSVKKRECASDPTIDNNLVMGSCKVFHDAFDVSRLQKIHDILSYSKENDLPIQLRVCWTIKDGSNCCNCEKCFRTICEIIVCGGDPNQFGFRVNKQVLSNLKEHMALHYQYDLVATAFWQEIQSFYLKNKRIIKSQHKKYLNWLDGFDFNNLKENKVYKTYEQKRKFISFVCRLVPRKVKDFLKKLLKR